MLSAICFNLDQSKILLSGNGLKENKPRVSVVMDYLFYSLCQDSDGLKTLENAFHPLQHEFFNTLPNDKILDWSKLKAFADDKISVNKKLKSGLERVENIVGKDENTGENAGYQHFLLFQQNFQKALLLRRDCLVKG